TSQRPSAAAKMGDVWAARRSTSGVVMKAGSSAIASRRPLAVLLHPGLAPLVDLVEQPHRPAGHLAHRLGEVRHRHELDDALTGEVPAPRQLGLVDEAAT